MKILIGVTCYRTILARTANTILDIVRKYPDVGVVFQNGVFVHENMNNLVKYAQEDKCSHIFFVEHDMVFPPDTLDRLLEQDKDIIAASYNYRCLPPTPMIYQKGDDGLFRMTYDIWPDKTFKCYGVPTGCTLIKMSVFDKISYPYFFFNYTQDGKLESSQDIYFCKKANEAGIEVWCDPTINIKHIGDYDY
jgi:GT2 family glycosyltransferase